MSFTQDIHILRSSGEIDQEIETQSSTLANEIKDVLVADSLKSPDGKASFKVSIPPLYEQKVLRLLAKWAKIYDYGVFYKKEKVVIYPRKAYIVYARNSLVRWIIERWAYIIFSAASILIIGWLGSWNIGAAAVIFFASIPINIMFWISGLERRLLIEKEIMSKNNIEYENNFNRVLLGKPGKISQ